MLKIIAFWVAAVIAFGFAVSIDRVEPKGGEINAILDTLPADTVAADTVAVFYTTGDTVPGLHDYIFKRCSFPGVYIALKLDEKPLKKGVARNIGPSLNYTQKKII